MKRAECQATSIVGLFAILSSNIHTYFQWRHEAISYSTLRMPFLRADDLYMAHSRGGRVSCGCFSID